MCINCLDLNMKRIEEYESEVTEALASLTCNCCRSYPSFLIGVNNDLKILCKTKIKRHNEEAIEDIAKLTFFEGMVKKRIRNKLDYVMEQLYDEKEDLDDSTYLSKMNDLKGFNDFVGILDTADQN